MLTSQILATLRFFDLQGLPLTAFEVHRFLIADISALRPHLDQRYELKDTPEALPAVSLNEVMAGLEALLEENKLATLRGFYCLPGRNKLILQRLNNYGHGIKRERLIRRYLKIAKFLPFIRSIALGGSQALGQQKASSDIDLFVILDANFLWTGRTILTAYFQLTGHRRTHQKIANRFCLNHYVAGVKKAGSDRDLYNAMEYLRLRPLAYAGTIADFLSANWDWIRAFYPNAELPTEFLEPAPALQRLLEALFRNAPGRWLERRLGILQLRHIKREDVTPGVDELAFHSRERKLALFREFFKPV